jgi:hypothetical protein
MPVRGFELEIFGYDIMLATLHRTTAPKSLNQRGNVDISLITQQSKATAF